MDITDWRERSDTATDQWLGTLVPVRKALLEVRVTSYAVRVSDTHISQPTTSADAVEGSSAYLGEVLDPRGPSAFGGDNQPWVMYVWMYVSYVQLQQNFPSMKL